MKLAMGVFHHRQSGFSLVELMICVAIVGVVSSIAVPQFMRFQLKAKSTEAKTNLKAIRAAEEAYCSEFGSFVAAAQTPASIPGTKPAPFAPVSPGFQQLGFEPAGEVFFAYAITVSSDGVGFTAEAAGDLDANSQNQYWGYAQPEGDGSTVPAAIGCTVANLVPSKLGPCHPTAGQSVF